MTPVLFVAAASVAAIIRWLVGLVVCSPHALLAVNVAGSALLGAAVAADLSAAPLTVIGVGFCGALTTYSSFALEVQRLGWRWGAAYCGLTVACVCLAASIGATFAG